MDFWYLNFGHLNLGYVHIDVWNLHVYANCPQQFGQLSFELRTAFRISCSIALLSTFFSAKPGTQKQSESMSEASVLITFHLPLQYAKR